MGEDEETQTPMQSETSSNGRRACGAKTKSGGACPTPAMKGGTRCRMHGGAAPQTKRAARERLMELREPAVVELNRILRKKDTSDADKIKVALAVLDRTGLGPTSKVEADVTVAPWQVVLSKVYGETGGDLGEAGLTEEQREAIESQDRGAMERELRDAQRRIRELEARPSDRFSLAAEVIDAEPDDEPEPKRRTSAPRELGPAIPPGAEPVAPSGEWVPSTAESTRIHEGAVPFRSADPRDAALRRAGYTAEPRTRRRSS